MIAGIFTVVVVLLIIIANALRIVQEYERGVVFRFGKLLPKVREPGIQWIIPLIDQMRKVSLRVITLPVHSQKIITRDNVSIDVAAVAYYQINHPVRSIIAIEDVVAAIYQIAQTTVRNVLGQSMLDEVLSETDKLNNSIREILDTATEQWGVIVTTVELKDIQLPDSMQRAMAKEAEAEREKRAKIIAAEGEQLSAAALGEAADVMAAHPIALQLRTLQALNEIATEKNSTIIFPAQIMDSVQGLRNFMSGEMGHSQQDK
jgi:regulator of protease activity HflC (stomatin/prohibitin superfamily)